MTKDKLINKTVKALSRLPQDKVNIVFEFAEFILKKYDEDVLQNGIKKIVSKSKVYDFLKDEEDIYTVKDLKEKY